MNQPRGYGHTTRATPGVSLPSGSRTRNLQILDPAYKPLRCSGDSSSLFPLLVRARPRISARIRAEPRPGLHSEDRTVRIVHQGLSRRRDGPSNQPLHATKQTTYPLNQTVHPTRHGHDFGAASSRARMLIRAGSASIRIPTRTSASVRDNPTYVAGSLCSRLPSLQTAGSQRVHQHPDVRILMHADVRTLMYAL
jgi:hypothetical protein